MGNSSSKKKTKKLVVVFGATGQQGGSVARALLADSAFSVRAITRNTQSDKAQQLKSQGAELCQADLDNKESLRAAVKDAKYVFLVTNFPENMDPQGEIDQGTAALEACKSEGVEHIVFTGLDNCKKLTGISVAYYESKAAIEDKIKESGVKYTNVRLAAYYENFLATMINRAEGNTFGVGVPLEDKPMDLIHVEGLGECVRTILKNPTKYNGQTLGLASDKLKIDDIVSTFNKHMNPDKNFINFNMTPDAFAQLGFPGAEEMANLFRCLQTGKCERDVTITRKLNPGILTFDAWVAQNKDKIAANLDKQPES